MLIKSLKLAICTFALCHCGFIVSLNAQNFSEAERSGEKIPEITVSSGGDGGTYFRFGSDIAKLASQFNVNLQVKTSKGSPDNLNRIARDSSSFHLGITQSDVMDELIIMRDGASESQEEQNQFIDNYRLVTPLYVEEVHLIVRRDSNLSSIFDLNNKDVYFGSPASGHHTTARVLFGSFGVKPNKIDMSSASEAINGVLNQDIDAVVYVAGAPASILNEHKRRKELSLLEISRQPYSDSYSSVVIGRSKYPWLDREVKTLGVKALLVTTDYNGPICSAIGKISCIVRENSSWFNRFGHPKWREVSGTSFADGQVRGWPLSDCVRDYLARGESCIVEDINKPTVVEVEKPVYIERTISKPATMREVILKEPSCDPQSSEYNLIACANFVASESQFGK